MTEFVILETELRHLRDTLAQIEVAAEKRRAEQEQEFRSINAELRSLRLDLEGGRGFTRGVRWAFAVMWLAVGTTITGAVSRLFGN